MQISHQADLSLTNLSGADPYTNLLSENLRGAHLSGADLRHRSLLCRSLLCRNYRTYLSQAKFSNTNLHASNFEGSIILKPIDLESSLIKLYERISSSNKSNNVELPVFTGALTDYEHLFRILQLKSNQKIYLS